MPFLSSPPSPFTPHHPLCRPLGEALGLSGTSVLGVPPRVLGVPPCVLGVPLCALGVPLRVLVCISRAEGDCCCAMGASVPEPGKVAAPRSQ